MPTPSSESIDHNTRGAHTTCPPDYERDDGRGNQDIVVEPIVTTNSNANLNTGTSIGQAAEMPLPISQQSVTIEPLAAATENIQSVNTADKIEIENDINSMETTNPRTTTAASPAAGILPNQNASPGNVQRPVHNNNSEQSEVTVSLIQEPVSRRSKFEPVRLLPSAPSSFLRSGSQFRGTQQSERQVYEVQVDIKHVDMKESYLCGYLRIQGLTEDHPTLTTYFEGEIIGSKYSFLTNHENWGSTDKVDLQHWSKFPAFRPFALTAKKGRADSIRDIAQRENIFMRWKEHFLVPDHTVRTINGASFEGFYYICFNQINATVSGIYFHARSEKFQQLELKHVPDKGCQAAMEFR